jgi:hypothetical protein
MRTHQKFKKQIGGGQNLSLSQRYNFFVGTYTSKCIYPCGRSMPPFFRCAGSQS